MTAGPFTRYFCPLECGWYYDLGEPVPGEGLREPLAQQPDESFQDLIGRLAETTMQTRQGKVEEALHNHLDTHTMMQAVTKAAEFRKARDEAHATVDRVREYAESRCTDEHANVASASWVLYLIENPATEQ
ncbi:hypothetical protein [Streptomyces lydicus]|uniref:hypothetical protein n=1 Tax=Streptomyces lydicus TaxID=47763 RepID=UPI0037A14B75